MSRKTINVDQVVDYVNDILKNQTLDDDASIFYRHGMMVVLEEILHRTGNYKGFRYLHRDEVPEGCMPGVQLKNGKPLDYPERFEKTDGTRRQY
jgi:hypothetical protein